MNEIKENNLNKFELQEEILEQVLDEYYGHFGDIDEDEIKHRVEQRFEKVNEKDNHYNKKMAILDEKIREIVGPRFDYEKHKKLSAIANHRDEVTEKFFHFLHNLQPLELKNYEFQINSKLLEYFLKNPGKNKLNTEAKKLIFKLNLIQSSKNLVKK